MKKLLIAAALGLGTLAAPLVAADSAPLVTKTGTIARPDAGKGLVVFFRPGSLMGAALGCTVYENGQQIARLGSGKYYTVTVDPGKHAFNTVAENKDVINVEVEPDEISFVKCKIGMGVMAGRPNLSPSDEAEFQKKAKGLAMWKGDKDK